MVPIILNSANEPVLSAESDVRSIPAIILLHIGQQVARAFGAMCAVEIVRRASEQVLTETV